MYLIQERLGNSQTDPSKHKQAQMSTIEHRWKPNEHKQRLNEHNWAVGTGINKHMNEHHWAWPRNKWAQMNMDEHEWAQVSTNEGQTGSGGYKQANRGKGAAHIHGGWAYVHNDSGCSTAVATLSPPPAGTGAAAQVWAGTGVAVIDKISTTMAPQVILLFKCCANSNFYTKSGNPFRLS